MKLTVTPLDDLVSIEYTDDDSFLYRKEMVPHHVASAYIAAFKGEVVFHKQPPLTLVTWNMPVLIGHRAHPVEQLAALHELNPWMGQGLKNRVILI